MVTKKRVSQTAKTVRTSISLPSELYKTLDGLAKKKKVSRAWIVRDALDAYVRDQWPLLERRSEL